MLGPLEVRVGGRAIDVTAGRLRALLAVLAMSAGRGVPPARLAAALWGEDRPRNPRRSIQTYVTRLRDVLGGEAIRTDPDGYLLAADDVDALRFARLLETAAGMQDGTQERACLVDALALWRGTPFDGIRTVWLEHEEAPRLIDRYLNAVERRIDLDLAAGLYGAVVDELRDLTARFPLRERFWAQLMTGLHRSGRRTEALETYKRLYRVLSDELGVRPGPAVHGLHRQILNGDMAPRTRRGDARARPPRQLPAAIGWFSGRTPVMARLDALLRPASTTVTAVIAGGPGMGKTTVALHWAHRVAGEFPDGQLYLNLRGFHPTGPALQPMDALRDLLKALGVPTVRIPLDLSARVGLYRSLLAGSRMLVVLDNARDANQVRPLLPGAAGCTAVLTSRSQLPGLVAEGAHLVVLGPLSVEEAREQLAHRLGDDRISGEVEATERLIALCAGLPLALDAVAERALARPRLSLDDLANDLDRSPARLDAFASADPASDIRATYSWSYSDLSQEAKRLLRLLSIHPGPDVTSSAVASLTGMALSEVRPLLTELCQAHLLAEHKPARYAIHELVRAYAAELRAVHDSEDDQNAARRRIFDHYSGTARISALTFEPPRDPIPFDAPVSTSPSNPFPRMTQQ